MLARIAQAELERAQWRVRVEDALRNSTTAASGPRSAPADSQRLRGIPMIGGAAGAIPGTVPHRNRRLDRWAGRGGRGSTLPEALGRTAGGLPASKTAVRASDSP